MIWLTNSTTLHTYYIIYIPNYETTGINDIADTKRVNCTFLSRVFAILNSNNSSRSLAWEIMRHNNTNKWLKISPRWSGEILINMAPLPLHTVFQKIYIWEQLINPTQKWNVILRTESSINWFCKKLISQNWFPKSKHLDWVIGKLVLLKNIILNIVSFGFFLLCNYCREICGKMYIFVWYVLFRQAKK